VGVGGRLVRTRVPPYSVPDVGSNRGNGWIIDPRDDRPTAPSMANKNNNNNNNKKKKKKKEEEEDTGEKNPIPADVRTQYVRL
jgi:hypothetical protein